jgi:hypothetical protein
VSGQFHDPAALLPEERAPGTHCIGGWMDHRGGPDDVEKKKFLTLSGFEIRPLGRPARSQLLYRLRYPGSPHKIGIHLMNYRSRWNNII